MSALPSPPFSVAWLSDRLYRITDDFGPAGKAVEIDGWKHALDDAWRQLLAHSEASEWAADYVSSRGDEGLTVVFGDTTRVIGRRGYGNFNVSYQVDRRRRRLCTRMTPRGAPYTPGVRRLLTALACIALLSACSAPDQAFGDTTTVERSDLGSTWPLTVDSVPLACNNGVVAVHVADRVTIIDQDTGGRGTSSTFIEIWARDESQPTGFMDLAPLVEYGQTLCD